MMDDDEIWKFIYENSGLSLSEFEAMGGVSGLLPPTPPSPGAPQLSTSSMSSASASASATASDSTVSTSTASAAAAAPVPPSALLDDLPSIPDAIETQFLLSADPSAALQQHQLPLQQPQLQLDIATLPPSNQQQSPPTGTAYHLSPSAHVGPNGVNLNVNGDITDAATWLQLQQAQLAYWSENSAPNTAGATGLLSPLEAGSTWEALQLEQQFHSPVWSVPAPLPLPLSVPLPGPLAADISPLPSLGAPSEPFATSPITNIGTCICAFVRAFAMSQVISIRC